MKKFTLPIYRSAVTCVVSMFCLFASAITYGQQAWTLLPETQPTSVIGIYAVDEGSDFQGGDGPIFLVGSNGLIRKSTTSGVEWTALNSGTTATLNDVFFIDRMVGWAVGNGVILRTINGGTSWTATSFPGINFQSINQYAINQTLWVSGSGGAIYRSNNLGVSWTAVNSNTVETLNDILPLTTSTIIAVGANGTITRSTDSGTTWSATTVGSTNLNAVSGIGNSVVIAVGASGTILRSITAGQSWSASTSGTTVSLLDVKLVDNVFVACGISGTILRSTNSSGTNWSIIPAGNTEFLGRITLRVEPPNVRLWIRGQKGILTSTLQTAACTAPQVSLTSPAAVTSCVGGSITLEANHSGTVGKRVWKRNGVTLNYEGSTVVHPTRVTLSNLQATDAGAYTMEVSGPCGTVTSNAITVTVNTVQAPSTIVGPGSVSQNVANTYSVSPISGATFNWSPGSGGTVTGSGNEVQITWSTKGSKTISVTATDACGTSIARNASVSVLTCTAPAQPSVITRTSGSECTNSSATYSVTAVAGVTYTWSVSAGGTITGSGNSATVVWNATSGSRTITVTPSNACGNGTARTLSVTVGSAPVQPSVISGNATVCTGVSTAYSVTNVTGTTYTWDTGGAGTITGSGNAINVTWTSSGAKTLTVTPTNSCGAGTVRTLSVTVNTVPAQPGVVVGSNSVGQNQSNQYSVTNQPGVTYTWNPGTGGTVTGSGNSVSISWSSSGSKTVTITPSNSCGDGTASTLNVTVTACSTPAQPSTITGNATACVGSSNMYSVTSVGGVNYAWDAGVDGNVSGSGNSVTLSWTSVGTKTITVTPFNDCGSGTPRTTTVVVSALPTQPSTITGNTTACLNSTNSYSITSVGGVTYTWDTGGKGTVTGSGNSVNVQWTAAGNNILTVTPSNGCGAGFARTLVVTVNSVPLGTSAVTGANLACTGVSSMYSVTNVSGVNYSWNPGAGGTVTGSGNSVSISWSTAGDKVVQVTPSNACGNGIVTSYNVSVTASAAQPGAITGSTAVDAGTTNTYSVPSVAGVSYAWSTNADGVIVGSGNAVQVSWATAGTKTLTVTPSTPCGNGPARDINVTVAAPCTIPTIPSVIITSGNANTTVNQTLRMQVTFSSGATSNDFAVVPSTGVTITPISGNTWDVTFTTAGKYTAIGKGVSACGTSAPATLDINVCALSLDPPASITGPTENICPGTTTRYTVENPIDGYSYDWTLGGATGLTIAYLNAARSVADITWTTDWTNVNVTVRSRNACNNTSTFGTTFPVALSTPPAFAPISTSPLGAVCVGGTITFTITNPESGVNYDWNLNGAGTVAGNKLSATVLADGQSRFIKVLGTKGCFVNQEVNSIGFNGGTPIPAQPSPVVGPSSINFNTDGTFTVEAQPSGVNFFWSAGGDATITNTASPNSKLIRWSTGGIKTININTANSCGISSSRSYSLFVNGPCEAPANPTPISGLSSGCADILYTFSVPYQPNVTYNWSAGADATITNSGNEVGIKWSTPGAKTISVTATNSCTTTSAQTKSFTVSGVPSQPASLTGGSLACSGSTEDFTVSPVVGGVTYVWEVQGGTFVLSGAQNQTASITWSSAGTSFIRVKASNACGLSAERSVSRLIETTPLQPSIINGDAEVCTGTQQAYSVTNVTGTTYDWNGGTGGTVTGSGNAVTISWSSTGSKTITVTPSNACGSGTARTLTVNATGVPAQPSVITGTALPTLGTSVDYSVANVNGVNYTWSLSDKGVLSSTGNSASVLWNSAGSSTLSVTPSNACGNGTARTQAITINKIPQTIAFTLTSPVLTTAEVNLSGTSDSGLPLSYASSNNAVAEVIGSTVFIKGSGSINITASQAGDNSYAAATNVVVPLTINKANQTITFNALAAQTFGNGSFVLDATTTSELSITFSSSNTSVITINGNIATIVGAGSTDITATQGGDAIFNAATPVVRALVVNKADQSISFDPLSAKGINDPPFTLTATASSELIVTYSSSNTSVATISGSTVTLLGEGTTIITATQTGNANYNAATPVEQTLEVNGKEAQTISFTALPSKTFGDANFELNATASSNLLVNYISSNTAVATISGSTVTIVGAGSTIITASQSGNEIYNPATSVQQTLIINKADQIISFTAIPDQLLSTGSLTLNATSTAGLDVSYESSNSSVATVSGAILTFHSAGTTTITASQAGNGNFNAALSVDQLLTITAKQSQSITFAALPLKTYGDPAFELTASASSDLPVQFVSSNTAVATVSGNLVTILGAGTAMITATQAGNNSFEAAADVVRELVVTKANQTITFSLPASVNFTTNTLSLLATSSVGLTIDFTSSNTAIATVNGNTLTFVTPGAVEITASQAGNTNYNAASQVIVPISIVDDRQTIALTGSLDFGNVLLGETATKTITIANTGNAVLQISEITLPQGFSSAVGPTTVNANASITAQITFAPTELKDYEGSVVISSNAVSGNNSITLNGTGVTITGFNEPGQLSGDLDVYPNPGTGVYIVKSKMTRNKSIAVMDMSGKAQYKILKSLDEEYHELDLLDLPEGIYYLKIEEKGSMAVKRIVKLN